MTTKKTTERAATRKKRKDQERAQTNQVMATLGCHKIKVRKVVLLFKYRDEVGSGEIRNRVVSLISAESYSPCETENAFQIVGR